MSATFYSPQYICCQDVVEVVDQGKLTISAGLNGALPDPQYISQDFFLEEG